MNTLSAALALAGRGFAVFPCCLPKKVPTCPHGFKNARTDPADVRALWRRWPGDLVGTPTGERNGFDALDIDPRHHGDVWLAQHRDRLPPTRIHQTRSGGQHFLFRHHTGVRNSESKIAPGVDTRGDGGYIIWWPAAGCPVLAEAAPADWPGWLLALLLPPPPEPQAPPPRPATHARSARQVRA
jgi:hypothetical protein